MSGDTTVASDFTDRVEIECVRDMVEAAGGDVLFGGLCVLDWPNFVSLPNCLNPAGACITDAGASSLEPDRNLPATDVSINPSVCSIPQSLVIASSCICILYPTGLFSPRIRVSSLGLSTSISGVASPSSSGG